ncbi:MAG: hypothetical protein QW123_01810 [Desulfurococcaceae archaeon]
MPTAKQAYIMSVLARKHGVIGSVAGRYVGAGYSVTLNHNTRYGTIDIVARRGNEVLAIKVFSKSGKISVEDVKVHVEKAKLLKAKPIVVLYGRDVQLSEEAKKFCDENSVRVRRVIP